jgi:hypothetical protein
MDTQQKRRQEWVAPRLEPRGDVAEVLKSGGGKLSIRGGDPGEMRCQRGATRCRT